MNPIIVAIQAILALAQNAPFAIATFNNIKASLAADPSVPAELAAQLRKTSDNNAQVHADVAKFLADNPS